MTAKTYIPINVTSALQPSDLIFLVQWVDRQQHLGQFVHFAHWLGSWVAAEIERRATPYCEPSMLTLPQSWSGEALADALCGSFVLVRMPMGATMSRFADAIHMQVVGYCSGVLGSLKTSEVDDE